MHLANGQNPAKSPEMTKMMLFFLEKRGIIMSETVIQRRGQSAEEEATRGQGGCIRIFSAAGRRGSRYGRNNSVRRENWCRLDLGKKAWVAIASLVSTLFASLCEKGCRNRPTPCGVSIGDPSIATGTLGCFVEKDRNHYLWRNNPVVVAANHAKVGDMVVQPGPAEGGCAQNDNIARLEPYQIWMSRGVLTATLMGGMEIAFRSYSSASYPFDTLQMDKRA